MLGGNLANSIADVADTVGTTAGLAGLATGATGIGLAATPFLEGLSGVANATAFAAGLFGDGIGASTGRMADVFEATEAESPAYAALRGAAHRLGEYTGLSLEEAQRVGGAAYMAMVRDNLAFEGATNPDFSDDAGQYYSGQSPDKLLSILGLQPPAEGELPTPRTLQLISDGAVSPPKGPGMTGEGPRLTVDQVMAAQRNLRENPQAARLYRSRLVTPGQAADGRFVSNLEHTALAQQKRPRRHSVVPRYRAARFAQK